MIGRSPIDDLVGELLHLGQGRSELRQVLVQLRIAGESANRRRADGGHCLDIVLNSFGNGAANLDVMQQHFLPVFRQADDLLVDQIKRIEQVVRWLNADLRRQVQLADLEVVERRQVVHCGD